MGMSASQARLLSITSRLTNNEFRSQTITNSKLRLAEKSQEASAEYMDALNSKQLVFGVYGDNGEYTTQKLTPALIYDYAPLKNQYALINPAGKMLVSAKDAQNYENTNTLHDFLDNYVNVSKVMTDKSKSELDKYNSDYSIYLKNKADHDDYLKRLNDYYEIDLPKYQEDYNAYLEDLKNYHEVELPRYQESLDEREKFFNSDEYKQYLQDKEDYNKEYQDYLDELAKLPADDMYKMFTDVVGTIYEPESCYENVIKGGGATCYKHVLTHLLGAVGGDEVSSDDFYTSTGVKINLDKDDITGSDIHGCNKTDLFVPVSNRMKDPTLLCDGDDRYTPPVRKNGVIIIDEVKDNIIQEAIDANRKPTETEILSSDYIYDEATNSVVGLKTLVQKAVDLLYLLRIGDSAADVDSIINFTDGDMKSIATAVPPVPVTEPEMPPVLDEPTMPTEPPMPKKPEYDKVIPVEPKKPVPTYNMVVDDKEKSQWYTNLWYMMNGSETANKVKQKEIHDDEENKTYTVFTVEGTSKSGKGGTYEVFEDMNLFKSADWLQFALEHGMVSMYQAQYHNPSLDSGKVPELTSEGITWRSIIYTNASDIRSQDDEVKIAIAEVKYKNAITEIENKDKKFDQDLKKLDTEHSALQTEYDSIKEVISKNTERSFKAFS